MPDVWLGRFSRWIEKWFNAKGGPALYSVDPGVQVVAPLPVGVEERYLQSWQRFTATANAAANAGNSGGTRFRNPAGSNVIAVVERLIVSSGATTNSFFNITQGAATTDLTTTETGFRLDSRGQPNSVIIVSLQNTTPAALASTMISVGASIIGRELVANPNQEFTILPGDALQVVDNTNNEQMVVTWGWRERALESSELT